MFLIKVHHRLILPWSSLVYFKIRYVLVLLYFMFWVFKLSISAIKIKLEGNPCVLKLSPGSFTYVVQFNFHKASQVFSFHWGSEKEMEAHGSSCRPWVDACVAPSNMPAVPYDMGSIGNLINWSSMFPFGGWQNYSGLSTLHRLYTPLPNQGYRSTIGIRLMQGQPTQVVLLTVEPASCPWGPCIAFRPRGDHERFVKCVANQDTTVRSLPLFIF